MSYILITIPTDQSLYLALTTRKIASTKITLKDGRFSTEKRNYLFTQHKCNCGTPCHRKNVVVTPGLAVLKGIRQLDEGKVCHGLRVIVIVCNLWVLEAAYL